MVGQFHTLVSTIYNGWALFGCFAYTFFVYIFALEKLVERRMYRVIQVASAVCVATAAYLVVIGVYQAIDWVNPFAGKSDDLANAVHNPKGWLIVAIIVVWPYLLILIGAVVGFIAQREFRGATCRLKSRAAAARP